MFEANIKYIFPSTKCDYKFVMYAQNNLNDNICPLRDGFQKTISSFLSHFIALGTYIFGPAAILIKTLSIGFMSGYSR